MYLISLLPGPMTISLFPQVILDNVISLNPGFFHWKERGLIGSSDARPGRAFLDLMLLIQHGSRHDSLQWRHNERDGVSNHQHSDCLVNHLFRRRSTKTSRLRVTGLCEENSPVIGEFPEHSARNVEIVSIWWLYYVYENRWDAGQLTWIWWKWILHMVDPWR